MMHMLISFAALSMAGTVVLSLLPEGGLKRTAVLAVGLLVLMCWAEGIADLISIELPVSSVPATLLSRTSVSLETAETSAASSLSGIWEGSP